MPAIINGEHNELLRYILRIKEAYPNLGSAERRVADCVLRSGEEILSASAKEIANQSGASPATVIRFCRSCGFSGLAEFKYTIRREIALSNRPFGELPVQPEDSVTMIRQKVMSYHDSVIRFMLTGWNEDAYLLAAEAILSANRILVTGEGGSQSTASCFTHMGLLLDLPLQLSSDPIFEALTIQNMKPGDVLVGITYTGRLRDTVESFRLARLRGIITVGLTGVAESPLLEYTDIPLTINLFESEDPVSIIGVRIAEMTVVELLYSVLCAKLGSHAEESVMAHLGGPEEIRRVQEQ